MSFAMAVRTPRYRVAACHNRKRLRNLLVGGVGQALRQISKNEWSIVEQASASTLCTREELPIRGPGTVLETDSHEDPL